MTITPHPFPVVIPTALYWAIENLCGALDAFCQGRWPYLLPVLMMMAPAVKCLLLDLCRGQTCGSRKQLAATGVSPEDVECPVCRECNSLPMVSSCGHCICEGCLIKIWVQRTTELPKCPVCNATTLYARCYPMKRLVESILPTEAGVDYGHVKFEVNARGLFYTMCLSDIFPGGDIPRLPWGAALTHEQCRHIITMYFRRKAVVWSSQALVLFSVPFAVAANRYAVPQALYLLCCVPTVILLRQGEAPNPEELMAMLATTVFIGILAAQLVAQPWLAICNASIPLIAYLFHAGFAN